MQRMLVQPSSAASGTDNDMLPVLRDAAAAVQAVLWSDRRRIFRCFVLVPAGCFAVLGACYGVHCLLSLGGVAFPASVACLVLLFLGLLLCDYVMGEHRTKKVVRVINVPGGWSLRWLNIFFTPAFVMLPLSPLISGVEVAKMIAVFIIGFVAMIAFCAYMTRAIQLLRKRPRKGLHDHADVDADATADQGEQLTPLREFSEPPTPSHDVSSALLHPPHALPPVPPPSHAAAYITIRGQNLDDPLSSFSDVQLPYPRISMPVVRPPRPRADQWADFVARHVDAFLMTTLLLLVGLPVYYATGYAMPLHLLINILMFYGAMGMPPSWRQILHPVIVSAFATLLAIYLLGRVRGDSLSAVLDAYRPGTTYTQLWAAAGTPAATNPALLARPGAGDVLASTLDISIVSLALPMYQYRHELRRHFVAIIVPNIVMSIASLFAYPVICYAIGISPERSLAFTSRSLTLALALPAVRNLGGDQNTVAAVAIISGVLGVLIGRQILSWLRIPEDDYVTRGVTFGANASALGTALLLRTDPRAAALSSLAMSLFGTVTVAFSSIPPMVHIIRSLVGLS